MEKLIDVKHVTKKYQQNEVFKDISFSVTSGEFIGLVGSNGMGKSTLLKMICGLIRSYDGSILIEGSNVDDNIRKIIGYIPDCEFLDEKLNAKEWAKLYKEIYQDFDYERCMGLFETLNIDQNQILKKSSKGDIEKVAMALLVSRNAKLLLLDEPLTNVDDRARKILVHELMENQMNGQTIIIATHITSAFERYLTRVITIKNKKLIDDYTHAIGSDLCSTLLNDKRGEL